MSTSGWLTISETISWTSRSRPKNRARSAALRSNGRGPTYGPSSALATSAERLPALAQLAREVPGVTPVHPDLDRLDLLEVAVQVLLGFVPPLRRLLGRRGIQLHRDARVTERGAERADEPTEEHTKVPVGQAVTDEEERGGSERAPDLRRQERLAVVLGDPNEEREVVVL